MILTLALNYKLEECLVSLNDCSLEHWTIPFA